MSESRVRENRTHGLKGGRWKRSVTAYGDSKDCRERRVGRTPTLPAVQHATAPAPYLTLLTRRFAVVAK